MTLHEGALPFTAQSPLSTLASSDVGRGAVPLTDPSAASPTRPPKSPLTTRMATLMMATMTPARAGAVEQPLKVVPVLRST
jgi:hypothetical protein